MNVMAVAHVFKKRVSNLLS